MSLFTRCHAIYTYNLAHKRSFFEAILWYQAKVLYMVPARQGLLLGSRELAQNCRIFLKYAIKSAFFRVSTLLLRYLKLNIVVGKSRFFSAAKTPAVQGLCTILLPDTMVYLRPTMVPSHPALLLEQRRSSGATAASPYAIMRRDWNQEGIVVIALFGPTPKKGPPCMFQVPLAAKLKWLPGIGTYYPTEGSYRH